MKIDWEISDEQLSLPIACRSEKRAKLLTDGNCFLVALYVYDGIDNDYHWEVRISESISIRLTGPNDIEAMKDKFLDVFKIRLRQIIADGQAEISIKQQRVDRIQSLLEAIP